MLTLRDAIPRAAPLAKAEFVTIRAKPIKIAARVIEHAARIRVHLPTGCPEQAWFGCIAAPLAALPANPQRVPAKLGNRISLDTRSGVVCA